MLLTEWLLGRMTCSENFGISCYDTAAHSVIRHWLLGVASIRLLAFSWSDSVDRSVWQFSRLGLQHHYSQQLFFPRIHSNSWHRSKVTCAFCKNKKPSPSSPPEVIIISRIITNRMILIIIISIIQQILFWWWWINCKLSNSSQQNLSVGIRPGCCNGFSFR